VGQVTGETDPLERSTGSAAGGSNVLAAAGGLLLRLGLAFVVLELSSILALSAIQLRPWRFGEQLAQRELLAAEHVAADLAASVPYGHPPIVVHPYLGYVRDHGSPAFHEHARGPTPVSEFGFEDDKPPLFRRSDDTLIVGFFGGSLSNRFAASVGGQALHDALARSFPDREIVFVHAALDGYKQPQQLIALAYLLTLGGEFDWVINIDGFNEVALPGRRNIDRGVAATYPRDWSLLIEQLPDSTDALLAGKALFLRDRRGAWARRFTAPPLCYSATAQLVWRVGDRWVAATLNRTLERIDASAHDLALHASMGPQVQYASPEALAAQMVEVWSHSSQLMASLCRAQGIEYIHFLQPNQYVAGTRVENPRAGQGKVYGDHPLRAAAEIGYPMLIETGEQLRTQGVRYHDLTDVFADTEDVVYSDMCCHLNDKGNQVLSHRIVEILLTDRH